MDPIYEGFLWPDPKTKFIKLVDLKGVILDSRKIKVWECIHPGSTINLVLYRVQVQGRLSVFDGKIF